MDWVLCSQFLGKFQILQDADDNLRENINWVFERGSVISEEAIRVLNSLDEQQSNDLQDWFYLHEN